MANRFQFPDSSPEPFTPDKKSRGGAGLFAGFGKEPSTTPAGPPPSASHSFTPTGAPSASYLGSSMIQGTAGSKPSLGGPRMQGKNLFPRDDKPSLRRPSRGSNGRGPSGLSHSFRAESAERDTPPAKPTGTFQLSFEDDEDDEDYEDDDDDDEYEEHAEDLDAEVEHYLDQDLAADDAEGEEEEDGEDMFLDMQHRNEPFANDPDDNDDLMVLTTPAADDRARREAEDIFRASSIRRTVGGRKRDFQFDAIARELYKQLGPAIISETADLVLNTEELCMTLYKEGIGAKDDADLLDSCMAKIVKELIQEWKGYAAELPDPEEHVAEIGPSPEAEPFKKAAYVGDLVLRMHHTRLEADFDDGKRPPLPEILFQWMKENHNLYPDQLREVKHHRPSPASHTLYWQTVRTTLVRGEVDRASTLLKAAGFEHVRKNRGQATHTGKALENIEFAMQQTCNMLDNCPGARGNWNIWSSEWTLFRVKARASLDQLQRFAEGKDGQLLGGGGGGDGSFPGQESLAGLARQAESQVPWEVYEQLNTLYDIALGDQAAILETAQDWCEATIGLCGWWDDEKDGRKKPRLSPHANLLHSTEVVAPEDYFDRLALAFHTAIESDFHFNPMNPVEVAIACAFEGNFAAVVGLVRSWSLPIACSVAEIASLGGWLPKPEPPNLLNMDTLDDDDLQVLGVPAQGPDELLGIKDTTLLHYAREVAGIEDLEKAHMQGGVGPGGWYMAIELLGRMDSIEGSEDAVGELLHDIIETFHDGSSRTVDKILRMLNDLGMQNFAEETSEAFADLLARDSHRYGEAIWYYARAHRAPKVREVLNLLISYSLINSTPYPSTSELDHHLRDLLTDRNTTLEKLASLDLEAAQLIGRMLSGYATLRAFYEVRDNESAGDIMSDRGLALRRQAAAALVAVIASSDDNIRGGLYDESRDAVVSEDFLLALLGEAMPLIDQSSPVITLEQMDVLLKAVEDIETVGSRVHDSCEEFFNVVLASAPNLKGSTPATLMQRSTSGLGGSYVMSGSSMLASQLHRSISGSASLGKAAKRGWDWRNGLKAGASAGDVVRLVRLGLSRDLARLWVREADNVALF